MSTSNIENTEIKIKSTAETPTKKYIQLPLFVDTTTLPTGKNHVSFSEILTHSGDGGHGIGGITSASGCSFRHKLQYIDKIPQENDGSIHTVFGKVLHDALEQFLLTGKMPPTQDTVELFLAQFEELKLTEEKREKEKKDLPLFAEVIPDILSQVPSWLDVTFPGWKTYAAEQPIFEKMELQNSIYFKGYIDAVIRIPDRKSVV